MQSYKFELFQQK